LVIKPVVVGFWIFMFAWGAIMGIIGLIYAAVFLWLGVEAVLQIYF